MASSGKIYDFSNDVPFGEPFPNFLLIRVWSRERPEKLSGGNENKVLNCLGSARDTWR